MCVTYVMDYSKDACPRPGADNEMKSEQEELGKAENQNVIIILLRVDTNYSASLALISQGLTTCRFLCFLPHNFYDRHLGILFLYPSLSFYPSHGDDDESVHLCRVYFFGVHI